MLRKGHILVIFVIVFIFVSGGTLFFQSSFGQIEFKEVTSDVGISFFGRTYGSAWGDVNEDGWYDLWSTNHGVHKNQTSNLYLNNGDGTFTDILQDLDLDYLSVKDNLGSAWVKDNHGAAWADFDNDGDQDLMIMAGRLKNSSGVLDEDPNVMLVNNHGTLIDKANELGLDFPLARGRMPLWFDWNNDGFLDILLVNSPRDDKKFPTTLLQNTGNFEVVTTFSEIRRIDSVQIRDLFGNNEKFLIALNPSAEGIYDINELPFKNIIVELNITKINSNDLIIEDFNGDLLPDLFRTTGAYAISPFETDLLEINIGNRFENRSLSSGFENPTSCKGAVGGDFDNDMDIDIFLVCGIWGSNTTKSVFHEDINLPNILFENLGNGTFIQVHNAGGAEGTLIGVAESVSMADYNNDGFLDLFITNGGGWTGFAEGGPHQMFRNLGNSNHWLQIDLIGTVSNRDGVGTKLLITAGDTTQLREQTGGIHFRAQNQDRIHVGLGENNVIEQIVFFWPSGIVHSIENVLVDQIIEVVEPTKPIAPNHQLKLGIEPSKILCSNGLELILKSSDGSPACVKPLTAQKLVERGWI